MPGKTDAGPRRTVHYRGIRREKQGETSKIARAREGAVRRNRGIRVGKAAAFAGRFRLLILICVLFSISKSQSTCGQRALP